MGMLSPGHASKPSLFTSCVKSSHWLCLSSKSLPGPGPTEKVTMPPIRSQRLTTFGLPSQSSLRCPKSIPIPTYMNPNALGGSSFPSQSAEACLHPKAPRLKSDAYCQHLTSPSSTWHEKVSPANLSILMHGEFCKGFHNFPPPHPSKSGFQIPLAALQTPAAALLLLLTTGI